MVAGLHGEFNAVSVVHISHGGVVNKNGGLDRRALESLRAVEEYCGRAVGIRGGSGRGL